jgi:hypothetical protein
MAKSNQKAKLIKQEANILSGFNEIITMLDQIADRVEQTMPLVSRSLRLTVAIVKSYKEAFNATKTKRTA